MYLQRCNLPKIEKKRKKETLRNLSETVFSARCSCLANLLTVTLLPKRSRSGPGDGNTVEGKAIRTYNAGQGSVTHRLNPRGPSELYAHKLVTCVDLKAELYKGRK